VRKRILQALCAVSLLAIASPAVAQDDRRDYPFLLSRGSVEVNAGHINYPFSGALLEPGHRVEAVEVPHFAGRLSLGFRLHEQLSLQVTYVRPIWWVEYRNLDGDASRHSVWMNISGAMLRLRQPITDRISLYGEGGLGIVTRKGIQARNAVVVRDALLTTPLVGAGIHYRLNGNWGVQLSAVYSTVQFTPPQPATIFSSMGITYQVDSGASRPPVVRGPEEEKVPIFPQHLIQLGYTTNALGYGFNSAVSPIFFQGEVDVRDGVSLHYQQNVFHTRKLFSIDWGMSASYKTSRFRNEPFLALSIFPLFRYTFLRTDSADFYGAYSLAGPTFISRPVLDGQVTGRRFTFQDLMAVGLYAGRNRHLNMEFRVGHYSNGNLIPQNPGIKVPLTFSLGYAFSNN
jgi:opacity protein-like surface antigen